LTENFIILPQIFWIKVQLDLTIMKLGHVYLKPIGICLKLLQYE